ncbi:hypothetical protein [Opitutus sp. ER46]|uniref:tetratricopeptide repeat protein n=1 Tax=Opitutus sp. ER46 TaxID=2161864 RepID=UPI000D31671C|nr:hypothetical protein [Opitutus sp. ER46]PTY01265.1 hypothetical protein DB354_00100 [Opitutus sp. ER46]
MQASRSGSIAYRVFALCLLFSAFALPTQAAVQGEVTTAEVRQFLVALADDYPAAPAQALINRVAENAMVNRIFRSPVAGNGKPWPGWRHGVLPALEGMLTGLDKFSMFVAARPIRTDDGPRLECQLLNADGAPRLLVLTLVRTAHGKIGISDIEISGIAMTFTTNVRHLYIIEGVSVSDLDSEELELTAFTANYGALIRGAMKQFVDGDIEEAYTLWRKLPEDFHRTRIWKYIQLSTAGRGSQRALTDAMGDLRATPASDPFLRLDLYAGASDFAGALRAVDDILVQHQEPVAFRCVKANLLLLAGQPAQSYALYEDIVDLAPYAVIAYLGGAKVAQSMGRPDLARLMVQRWGRIAAPPDIDKTLSAIPEFAPLRASAEYQAWLKAAPPNSAVPSQPASAAPSPETP